MAALVRFLKSSILSKVVMAATGLVLVLFLLGHMAGNLQMYLGQEKMNTYAETLQGLGSLLWVIRAALFVFLVLHVITSIKLKWENYTARPEQYTVKKYVRASLSSRTMIWTGVMIFLFLTYHLLHFTVRATNPSYGGLFDALGRPDVYSMVVIGYSNVLIAVVYIAAMLLLGFHLFHAIESMFQTLGVNHEKYNPFIHGLSLTVSTIIMLGFISIPVGVLFGWIELPAGVIVL
ncbi:MAG: succinate dehydrogenase cytochrome b subunit [Bacteroidetes bacterium]|nr:succinate dehydrogenase cytochrome b subunit [Bacteroidota bacterium]